MRSSNSGYLLSFLLVSFAVLAEPAEPSTPSPDVPKREAFGWDGSHFFVQSPDGSFLLQPYGYVQSDYRVYTGDGVPPDTFTIRRARFGFQGKLDNYYEFAFLVDFADRNSTLLRDAFVNINYVRELQFTFGQMIEPFGQEAASFSIANVDFVERGLTSLLYPSASGSFRSPGAMIHGDIGKGFFSYWLGAFNGKGPLAANTTNQPEVIARIRMYPFRGGDNRELQGLAIGGAAGYGRSRALSNELSFSGLTPEGAFTFFPQLLINGAVYRFNGELTWTVGPGALRAEIDALHQNRDNLFDGYAKLGQVRAWGYNIVATWLLTGEKQPENAPPKVPPLFKGGIGAWELKARYSYLTAEADGDQLNILRIFKGTVDEISGGFNWYLTSTVRYAADVNVYRQKDTATVGGAPPQTFVVVLQRMQFRF